MCGWSSGCASISLAAAAIAAGAPAPARAHSARCDEGRIVFTRTGEDGIPSVFSTDPCTGHVTRIATGHHATLSPDGRLLAYDSILDGQHTTDVFVSRPDGSAARDITNSPGKNDLEPAFSPDGRSIAYSTGTDGTRDARTSRSRPSRAARPGRSRRPCPGRKRSIRAGRHGAADRVRHAGKRPGPPLDRPRRRPLPPQHHDDADDACQPDRGPGGLIAYAGGCDQLQSHLFLRDRGGRHVRQLTTDADGGSSQRPAFSPDGRWLTFSKFDANFDDGDVWRLDLRTGAETDLVSGPTFDFWSDWGPAGR